MWLYNKWYILFWKIFVYWNFSCGLDIESNWHYLHCPKFIIDRTTLLDPLFFINVDVLSNNVTNYVRILLCGDSSLDGMAMPQY